MRALTAVITLSLSALCVSTKEYVTFDDVMQNKYGKSLMSNPKWTKAIPETGWSGYNTRDSEGIKTKVLTVTGTSSERPQPAAPSDRNLNLTDNLVMSNQIYNELNADAWWISANNLYVIFRANTRYIFRHSYIADYFVYFPATEKSVLNITDVQFISFAPTDDQKIAYIQGNNLFYTMLPSGKTIQVTEEGSEKLFSGISDWVYEEEMFGTTEAYFFSDDSRYIAYATIDDADIDDIEYQLVNKYTDVYPEMKVLGYPKAGSAKDPNPIANLYVYDSLSNKKAGPLYIPLELQEEGNPILGRISWLPDDTLVISWLNRFQNRNFMYSYKNSNGVWYEIKIDEQVEEAGWIGQPNDIYSTNDNTGDFLMIQSDGSNQHIFRLSSTSENKTQITVGPVDVTKIYGSRANHDYGSGNFAHVVLFQAAPNSDQRHIYGLNLNLGFDAGWKFTKYPVAWQPADIDPNNDDSIDGAWYCYTCLDYCWQGGSNCRMNPYDYTGEAVREKCEYWDMYNPDIGNPDDNRGTIEAGGVNDVALLTCYGPSVPYQFFTRICEHNENMYPWSQFLLVKDNYEVEEKVENEKDLGVSKRGQFASSTGFEFEYKIMYPPNFDADYEYPVLFHVYSGPASSMIEDRWSVDFNKDFMTSPESTPETGKGWVVVYLDSRGMNGKGNAIKFAQYKKFGQVEKVDLTEFAQALISGTEVAELKVDAKHVAIWGWSYGGFTTSHVLGYQDPTWSCGVAVAPVADFRFYDSIYTERYMQDTVTNKDGYELSNAMGALNEKSYFGKYTVIHGTGDDNVHFQNSAVMTKEIINKGFEFNAYFYADEQHGINSDSHQHNHVYGLIWRKLNDCLNDRL